MDRSQLDDSQLGNSQLDVGGERSINSSTNSSTTIERWWVAQGAAELIVKASKVPWKGEMREWLDNTLLGYGLKGIPQYRNTKAQYGKSVRSLVEGPGASEMPSSDTSSPRIFDQCSRSSNLDSVLPPLPTISPQGSTYNTSIGQNAAFTKNNSNMPSASVPKEKYVSVTTITTTDILELTPRESVHNPEPGKKRLEGISRGCSGIDAGY